MSTVQSSRKTAHAYFIERCGQNNRQPFPDYLNDFLLQKYGLQSIVTKQLDSLISNVHSMGAANYRVALFGRLLGLLDPGRYCPRLADFVVKVLDVVYKPFTATSFRVDKKR